MESYEYDPEKRRLAKVYTKSKIVHLIINKFAIPVALFSILLITGLSSAIRDFGVGIIDLWYVYIPIYTFILLSIILLIDFPFSFYSSFIFEHKYNLSNQSFIDWLKDFLKTLGLTYGFSIPVVLGLYYLLRFEYWWIFATIAYFFLVLIGTNIFTLFIFPLFYKTESYEDESQKERLFEMTRSAGVDIKNIIVAKESERSKKANAMFTGLGRVKRIILFDTLTENFPPDEIETIVAHELGHYVNKDIIRSITIGCAEVLPIFFIIHIVLNEAIGMFGITGIEDIAAFPLFALIFTLINFGLAPLINVYSRSVEKKADEFSLNATNKPDPFISSEKRLADMNLSDDHPSSLMLTFFTHPPASKRIEDAEEWKRKRMNA
jgi:STE24 endopeptidase